MLEKKQKKKNQLKAYVKYSTLAVQMAAIIFLGVYFGNYVDIKSNNTIPVYSVVFSVASIAASLYHVLIKLKNDN